jgi:hypothetical protein
MSATKPSKPNSDKSKKPYVVKPLPKSVIPETFFDADVTLLFGKAGDGKTLFTFFHPKADKAIFFDLENRYKETLKHNPYLRREQVIVVPVFTKEYMLNPVRTFNIINKKIIEMLDKVPPLIVFDGIQDIRMLAIEYWKKKNGKNPAKNWSGWHEINDLVKAVVHKLVNYTRLMGTQIIFTTTIAEEYVEGVRTGITFVAAKDYITTHMSQILKVKRTDMTYEVKRGKSPKGASPWVDITNPDLLEVFD